MLDEVRHLPHEIRVELRQHDHVELQPLGLVDRHHADVGGQRIGHALPLDQARKSSVRNVASGS